MLINLSDVLSERHTMVDETVQVGMDEIRLKAGRYPIGQKEPVHVTVTHVKDKELEIHVETKLSVVIPCDRCLADVEREFVLDFSRMVDLAASEGELKEGFDESDCIDGYNLDVDKMLYSEMLIGWPTKVLCKEDCKGICNVCGQNLNEGTCDCEDTGLDPRMSVVRDLFKNCNGSAGSARLPR